jgi:hypothetical protein
MGLAGRELVDPVWMIGFPCQRTVPIILDAIMVGVKVCRKTVLENLRISGLIQTPVSFLLHQNQFHSIARLSQR